MLCRSVQCNERSLPLGSGSPGMRINRCRDEAIGEVHVAANFPSEMKASWWQEEVLEPVARQDVQPGDLIFFGRGKATHVGLCSAVERSPQAAEPAPNQVAQMEAALLRAKSCGTNACNNSEVIMYVHSSSAEYGHGKIAVDSLTADGGTVARHYFSMLRSFGRVTSSLKSSCLGLANASTTART
eukprot:SM000011S19182  [mRNA]  locus=s11:1314064:1315038:- [translate_table: standard]